MSKTQNVAQNKVSDPGALKAGYVMNYNYNSNSKHQLDNVTETEYRTKNTDPKVDKQKNNKYVYDANGNMIYVNTEEVKADGKVAEKAFEKKMLWDEENRLGAVSINGYVSSYSYDAGGERVTKMSGGGQGIFVNSVFSGGKTSTSDFTLYVNPYLVAQNGGRYTKHIYIGSQRIVSKLGDFDSYGADPRRVEKAGESFSGVKVDYDTKYKKSLQTVKANYASLDVPYYGLDNNDYVNGLGFCCNPSGDTGTSGSSTGKMTAKNDNAELQQFYYHPDHLGSSSYISNLDGEVVQHVEYVPFGEVFLEEKNAKWNTPYLFTSKELDRETGMYYFGARYQDPKLGIFISVDPLAEQYAGSSSYAYALNNPVTFIDPDGKEIFVPFMGDPNSSSNRKHKAQITASMQKLTNSRIKLVETKGGYIVKTVEGKANESKKLTEGTKLVSDLIKSKKRVTVEAKEGHENITLKSKNGNSKIIFDPTNLSDGVTRPGIQNEDGTDGRPSEIGLGHELIHADFNAKGEVDKTPVDVINPDGYYRGRKVTTDQDEVNSRTRENVIRKEQGVKPRKVLKPEWKN